VALLAPGQSTRVLHETPQATAVQAHDPQVRRRIGCQFRLEFEDDMLAVGRNAKSAYGPATLAGGDGSRQPVDEELITARNLGSRVAQAAEHLKPLRQRQAHGQQGDAPTYEE
jgi:hypothetical protein